MPTYHRKPWVSLHNEKLQPIPTNLEFFHPSLILTFWLLWIIAFNKWAHWINSLEAKMVSVPGVAPCVLVTLTLDPSTTGSHRGAWRGLVSEISKKNWEFHVSRAFSCMSYINCKFIFYILAWFAVIGYPCLMSSTSLDREVDALPPSLNELGPATQLRSVHSYRGEPGPDGWSLVEDWCQRGFERFAIFTGGELVVKPGPLGRNQPLAVSV